MRRNTVPNRRRMTLCIRIPAVVLLAAACVVSACATTKPVVYDTFDDEVVVGDAENATIDDDGLSDDDLLAQAKDLAGAGNCADALPILQRIRERSTRAAVLQLARFYDVNCSLEMKDATRSLQGAREYLSGLPAGTSESTVVGANIRYGAALMLNEQYEEALTLFEELTTKATDPETEIELLVDVGIAHFMLKRYLEAESRLLRARRLYQEGKNVQRLSLKYHIAQATFYLAEIARADVDGYPLIPVPEDANGQTLVLTSTLVETRLEEKAQRVLRAQHAYLRVIREEHSGWASAAGFRVGEMYEVLYDELSTMPEPSDLSEGERKAYRTMLDDRIGILLEKAVRVWQSTIEMAVRTDEDNEWVSRTEASLERLRVMLKERRERSKVS